MYYVKNLVCTPVLFLRFLKQTVHNFQNRNSGMMKLFITLPMYSDIKGDTFRGMRAHAHTSTSTQNNMKQTCQPRFSESKGGQSRVWNKILYVTRDESRFFPQVLLPSRKDFSHLQEKSATFAPCYIMYYFVTGIAYRPDVNAFS